MTPLPTSSRVSALLQLLVRRFMRPTTLGGGAKWEYEIGEPPKKFDASDQLMQVSESKNVREVTQPIFLRTDTPTKFEWRVRNLKWAKECYILEVDHTSQEIVIKTTVKK